MIKTTVGVAPAGRWVYVLVLSWNRLQDTLACLHSAALLTYPHYRLLLVDNASTDNTVEAVRGLFPQVEVLVNERNLGFAAGCNVGLNYALGQGAEYVLLLNNDAVVDREMLSRLIEVAIERSDCGPLGPRIFYEDRPAVVWSDGGYRHTLTLAWRGDHEGATERALEARTSPRPVDYLVGCGMLLSRRLLKEIGGFDERFFFYYEDLDLCLRAQRAGFQPLNVPSARMWHKVSASIGEHSPLQRYHLARSSVLFYHEHTQRPLLPLIVLYRLGSALMTVLFRCLLRGESGAARAYLRGLRDGLAEIYNRAD